MPMTLPRWQFNSLTLRLLCTCVAAAAVIYGVSFVQMRQIARDSIHGWVSQMALALACAWPDRGQ